MITLTDLPDPDDVATVISDRYTDLLDIDGITSSGWRDIAETVIKSIFGAEYVETRATDKALVDRTFGVTGNLNASVNLQTVLRELGTDALSDNGLARLAHLHREAAAHQ